MSFYHGPDSPSDGSAENFAPQVLMRNSIDKVDRMVLYVERITENPPGKDQVSPMLKPFYQHVHSLWEFDSATGNFAGRPAIKILYWDCPVELESFYSDRVWDRNGNESFIRSLEFSAWGEGRPIIRRNWASLFGFRPENFGLSNNGAAVNCVFTQYFYADFAAATDRRDPEVHPLELSRYSFELLLRGGSGVGRNENHYLDSASSILIGSAVVAAQDSDAQWLRAQWPELLRLYRLLRRRCTGEGMICSDQLTGNRGERIWSTNWWDLICWWGRDRRISHFYEKYRRSRSLGMS